MSKIVFFCIPAYGHTNPTLGVVRELIARGHAVWYYSYNNLRSVIESTGAEFISCDQYDAQWRVDPKDAARVGKDLAVSTRILVDTTLALDDAVCEEMKRIGPDCIVADSMAVWGKAVAMKLGIPFVSSTTTFAFNQHSARIMKQSLWDGMKLLLSMPKIGKDIKRLQEKGYPVKSVLDLIQNDENTHTIVYTSPEFQPCSDTFSDRYAFVGPSIRPVTAPIEKKREKLIYVSMGTVNNDMLPLYRCCISALGGMAHQVILSVGGSVELSAFGTLPENVEVYQMVDQIAVLEKADAFLTHCGMNSVSEALYFGVPLVMLPQTAEQGGVAERVSQLGAGIRLQKATAKAIREAMETICKEPFYRERAQAIRRGFLSSSGAKGAADKIESVMNG